MQHSRLKFAAALAALLIAAVTSWAADRNDPVDVTQYKDTIRLACVGDSITAGAGVSAGNFYPQQLNKMLGDHWKVMNFGVSGSTLINNGDKPYQKERAFKQALDFKPDVVIIMLGTNDTKPQNWVHKDNFVSDYKDLIGKFQALESKPRVFIVRPCVVLRKGAYRITEEVLQDQLPMIDALGKELGLGVIDVHSATEAAAKEKPALIPDTVHPNAEGAELMSKVFFKALTGKEYDGPTTLVSPKPKAAPSTRPSEKTP